MRKFVAAFYVLLGPCWLLIGCPDHTFAVQMALPALLGGMMVARIHLRQSSTGGRVAVAIGTVMSSTAGVGVLAVTVLALAFAGDSGQHAELLGKLAIWSIVITLLAAPPLGAQIASSLFNFIQSRRGRTSNPTSEP